MLFLDKETKYSHEMWTNAAKHFVANDTIHLLLI